MTIKEMRASDKAFLTCADIAPAIGSDPHALRIEARKPDSRLPFPVLLIGTRVKIPREGFLRWYSGEVHA